MKQVLAGCGLIVLSCMRGANSACADDIVLSMLQHARAAISSAPLHAPPRYAISGTLTGEGLRGTSSELVDGDREREDEILGLRTQRTVRMGGRFYRSDGNGNQRDLSGSDRAELLTASTIEDGSYLDHPEWFSAAMNADTPDALELCFAMQPPQGARDVVCFDKKTALLSRRTMINADGQESMFFGDWRQVGDYRFPFRVDVAETGTTATIRLTVDHIDIDPPVDDAAFSATRAPSTAFLAPVTLPLEMHDDHLYLPVAIGGKSYHFLLDTGSANIVIDQRVAAELGLHTQGTLGVLAADRSGTASFAKVSEIGIGGATLQDQSVAVADLGTSIDGSSHIDGILGYPFFAAAEVRIDTAAASATLGAPGSLPPLGERLALDLDRGVPETAAVLGSTLRAPVMIDTGSAASMLLYHPFATAHASLIEPGDRRDTTFAIGGTVDSSAGTLPLLTLGTTEVHDVPVDEMDAQTGAFADLIDAGSVGMGVLSQYVTTIDETGRALYLAPHAGVKP